MKPAIVRLQAWCERGLVAGCAVVLLWLMGLTVVDVAMRYLFSKPVRGAHELTEISLALLIYLGLPLVSIKNMHIATDLIDPFLRGVVRRLLPVVIDLVCGVALVGVGVVLFEKAERIAASGETTSILALSLAPVAYLVAVLMFVTAVIHLLRGMAGGSASESTNVI